ncbi:MAG: hypothetical protein WCK67_07980 [bacterium]
MLLVIATPSFAYDRVSGYTRSNGTYVNSYVRSDSNSTKLDNYSTQGNMNPNTGQYGTLNVNTPQQNYGANDGRTYNYKGY